MLFTIFLSFRKLTALLCLVCSLLFHSGVAEWSPGSGVSSALQELFTRAGQHIWTCLVFSADCAEAKTLSQAHIHGLEIRCVMQLSHEYSRVSHELSQASIYWLEPSVYVGYTSNLKSYCTLKNNSHWIRVLHYCCLLLAASMTTTIEQLPVKDAVRVQGDFGIRCLWCFT